MLRISVNTIEPSAHATGLSGIPARSRESLHRPSHRPSGYCRRECRRFGGAVNRRHVRAPPCPGAGTSGRWHVPALACPGAGMSGRRHVRVPACPGAGMSGRWHVRALACQGAGTSGCRHVRASGAEGSALREGAGSHSEYLARGNPPVQRGTHSSRFGFAQAEQLRVVQRAAAVNDRLHPWLPSGARWADCSATIQAARSAGKLPT